MTITNEEGAHVLAGIVSKRLGESCNQEDFAVYTSVSALLPWIELTIHENGGMASCNFSFSAPPTLGFAVIASHIFSNQNEKLIRILQEYLQSLLLRQV